MKTKKATAGAKAVARATRKKPATKKKAAGIAHPQQRAFLAAFAECGNVKRAAALAGISREAHYDWRAHDEPYAAAFEQATVIACDALEGEALRRAKDGVAEIVVSGGYVVLHNKKPLKRVKYSDALLATLLKAWLPHKYGDRQKVEVTTPAPLDVRVTFVKPDAASDE
jgi:hypothetical protein